MIEMTGAGMRTQPRFVGWAGVIGSVLLALYFGIPAFVPRLGALLYSSGTPSTARVVAVGAEYRVLIGLGSWFQGVGALCCVVFFFGVVDMADGAGTLAGRMVGLGSAVLVAVVAAEMLFGFTWAHNAAVGQFGSARTAYDLTSQFSQVFPIVPAPTVYLALGWVLNRRRDVLGPVLTRLALTLGAGFLLAGLVGAITTAAGPAVAALSGLQDVWILAAAVVLLRSTAGATSPTNGLVIGRSRASANDCGERSG